MWRVFARGPKEGEAAPEVVLSNQEGREVRVSTFRGKKGVLIAFYPMDFTPG